MHSHTNELILIRFSLEYLEWLSKIQEQYPKNQFSVPPPCQSKRTRRMKKEQATEEIADRHSQVDYRRD